MDTGSNISIVRPDVLGGASQKLIEPVDSCLRTVTGEHAPIHGRGQLQLGIGSLVLPQELWVADIHDEWILGLDFLQAHSCQVNLKDGSLVIGEEEIPLRKSKASKEPNCYKAVLTEGVCLLPLAETVVPIRVDGAQADYRWGLLEQPSSFDDLLLARTLVDLQRKEVPLSVMNLSNQQRVIHKSTELACCETIHSVLASRVDAERRMVTGCTQNAKILVKKNCMNVQLQHWTRMSFKTNC